MSNQADQPEEAGPGPESGAHGEPTAVDPASGAEMSLNELGRAYARAVGLIPEAGEESTDEETVADETVCPVSPRSILEAILFVGTDDPREPLTTRKIASWIRDVSAREISQLVREINEDYRQDESAIRIARDKQKVWLELCGDYEPVREAFYGEVRKARLSQQAIDVLAVVAYHQPTTRDHVSDLRGRDCSGILNQLVKRELLSVTPDPENSRTRIYQTTERFLDLFGLDSLEDLPQSAESLLPDADIE